MTDEPNTLNMSEEGSQIAPFVVLLGAHMDLISETSEETALRLSDGLSALRKTLIDLGSNEPESDGLESALNQTSELQSVLQSQDILRQQVVAVRDGLASLANLRTDDVMHHINDLKGGYVMPQQWHIHARITGEEPAEAPSHDGPVFSDQRQLRSPAPLTCCR